MPADYTESQKDDREQIENLYPGYTPDECAEAEYALSRYLNLVRRIYDGNNTVIYSENFENIDDSAFKR